MHYWSKYKAIAVVKSAVSFLLVALNKLEGYTQCPPLSHICMMNFLLRSKLSHKTANKTVQNK